jgi:hypothetical protein
VACPQILSETNLKLKIKAQISIKQKKKSFSTIWSIEKIARKTFSPVVAGAGRDPPVLAPPQRQ